jgi:allantoicase
MQRMPIHRPTCLPRKRKTASHGSSSSPTTSTTRKSFSHSNALLRETRRRREPGCDWCIIELATPGEIRKVEVDTAHFKGNFADRCSLQGAYVSAGTDESLITQSMFWAVLLDEQKLQRDRVHEFTPDQLTPVTHVRFNILPDGGVSRLRLIGRALA